MPVPAGPSGTIAAEQRYLQGISILSPQCSLSTHHDRDVVLLMAEIMDHLMLHKVVSQNKRPSIYVL